LRISVTGETGENQGSDGAEGSGPGVGGSGTGGGSGGKAGPRLSQSGGGAHSSLAEEAVDQLQENEKIIAGTKKKPLKSYL
jgi:hypothetical protein